MIFFYFVIEYVEFFVLYFSAVRASELILAMLIEFEYSNILY